MTNRPQTVSELFPSKWLKPVDLTRPATVTIEAVSFDKVYDRREGAYVEKLTISFEKCVKRLIPNPTQAKAIWAITKTERFADWPGHRVTLAPGRAHNGKATIVISGPLSNGNGNAPMPQAVAVQAALDETSDATTADSYYSQE